MSVENPVLDPVREEFITHVSLPDILRKELLPAPFLNSLDPRLVAGQAPDAVIGLSAGRMLTGEQTSLILPDERSVMTMNVAAISRATGFVCAPHLAALEAGACDANSLGAVEHQGYKYARVLPRLSKMLEGIGVELGRKKFTTLDPVIWRFPGLIAFRTEGEAPVSEAFLSLSSQERQWFAELVLKTIGVPFPVDEATVEQVQATTTLPEALRRRRKAKAMEAANRPSRRGVKPGASQNKRPEPKAPPPLVPDPRKESGIEPDGPEWWRLGVCRDEDPEIFYPERAADSKQAKRICRECEVRAKCLEDALATEELGEEAGVRGGLTHLERRRLKRRLAAEQEQKNAQAVAVTPKTEESVGPAEVLPNDTLVGELAAN